jgi:hypothetical protein
MAAGEDQPVLRIVRGGPTDDELAAVLAVITAKAAAHPQFTHPRSAWADPAHQLRRPLSPGPGAWRLSQRLR